MPTRICADGGIVLHRAREERDLDAQFAARLLEGQEVLLGQRFRRRHQRALLPSLDCPEKRVQRDDRLARADLALKEPLHRRRLCEVGVDLLDRALLVRREREGEQLAIARRELSGLGECRSALVFAPTSAAGQPDLEDEELVQCEPAAARLGFSLVPRTVQGGERVRAQRQARLLLEVSGNEVGEVTGVRECLAGELPELLDGHLLARRVDRREIGRRGGAVQVVGADGELVATELASEANVRARLQLLGEPDLVEPDRGHLAAVVGDPGLDDREAAPGAAHGGPQDLAGDRDFLLAGEEVGDRHLGRGSLVAKRPVRKQVADRAQAELGELLRQCGPHACERVQASLEPLRTRKATRTGPRRRCRGLGEGGRKGSRQGDVEYRTGAR